VSLSKPLKPSVQLKANNGDVSLMTKQKFDYMLEIERLRARIDEIDEEIIRLLRERIEVASRIGEVKARLGLPVVDEGREKVVLERAGEFRQVFEAIIRVSRDVQRVRVLQQDKRD